MGKIVKEWAQQEGIIWQCHLPYSPEANGVVERANAEVKWFIKLFKLRSTDFPTIKWRMNRRALKMGIPIDMVFQPGEVVYLSEQDEQPWRLSIGDKVLFKQKTDEKQWR